MYSNVAFLRSYYSKAFLCLTATSNTSTTRSLKTILGLSNPLLFKLSPEKLNIKLHVNNISQSSDKYSHFLNLANTLLRKDYVPKTIIYCSRREDCGELYVFLKNHIQTVYPRDNLPIAMFHSVTSQNCKRHVLDEFPKVDSVLRVVIATCALGLGINIADIRNIIHYGGASDIESYVQEIGRAGRDGLNANAYLIYTNSQLAKCDDTMKEYAKNTNSLCRRVLLLKTFCEKPQQVNRDLCCDLCSSPTNEDSDMMVDDEDNADIPVRDVSVEERQLFHDILNEHNEQFSNHHTMDMNIFNLFSASMMADITEQCHSLFLYDDIQKRFNIISPILVQAVLKALSDVFDDIDINEIMKGEIDNTDLPFDISNLLLQPYGTEESQSSASCSQDSAAQSQDSQNSAAQSQDSQNRLGLFFDIVSYC